MAAVTPTSLTRDSLGSVTLVTGTFASGCATGDTWTTGMKGVLKAWANMTAAPGTQGSVGVGCSVSNNVITLRPGEDSKAFEIYVLLRS